MNGDSPTACVAALATEIASASIAASDCTAATGADRGSFCGERSIGESLPESLHLFRPVTQDTGSKIAILSFGGQGHGKHCNDLLAQALEARGVQFRH